LYSSSEIDKLLFSGIQKDKIFVANNTIEVLNASFNQNVEKCSFLFVGRAQKRKQVDDLIHSFSNIQHRIPSNINLEIVGEGQENIYLKELVKELKIDHRITFHGKITDDSKLKILFQKSFAYVSPGPVGLGVLHSFAYGVPVVTMRNKKHGPEGDLLVDGINSILYDESVQLDNILVNLVNNLSCSSCGLNAYNLYASQLTMSKMVKGFREVIDYMCVK
jgi:glycosyltransferase involved in cell wall biosynthesis